LLPLGHTLLHLLGAVGAELLALGLAGLRLLHAVVANLLALEPDLLALNPRGGNALLTFNPGLLALNPHRGNALLTFDPGLLALDPHRGDALLPLYANLLALHAHLLALHARRLRSGLLSLGSLRTLGDAIFVRPRICRGCDRQRGDSRGEKHPGHHKISFRTARTVRPPHRSHRLTDGTRVLAHQHEQQMSHLFR
jgi:hypothetical protein